MLTPSLLIDKNPRQREAMNTGWLSYGLHTSPGTVNCGERALFPAGAASLLDPSSRGLFSIAYGCLPHLWKLATDPFLCLSSVFTLKV